MPYLRRVFAGLSVGCILAASPAAARVAARSGMALTLPKELSAEDSQTVEADVV